MYDPALGGSQAGDEDYHFNEFIPHLVVGRNMDGAVISATFAKTDTPYLKEARYFSDAGGSLIQLANVYDVNGMKLHHNTFMYPGQINWIEFQDLKYCGGGPGQRGSIANQLGLGGYHIVKKVTSTIYPNLKGETSIDAVWVYSGATEVRKKSDAPAPIDSPDECGVIVTDTDRTADQKEIEAKSQMTEDYPTGTPKAMGGEGLPNTEEM